MPQQGRLPCLESQPVVVSQAFNFSALPGQPETKHLEPTEPQAAAASALETELEPEPNTRGPSCLVMPHNKPRAPPTWETGLVVKVMSEVSFEGDGQAAPQVKIIYSNATAPFLESVRHYLADARMPCRKVGDPPRKVGQLFVFTYGATAAHFKAGVVPLAKFLGSLRGIKEQQVVFDTKLMACPFQLEWQSMRPAAVI